jgi:hypothetical protein
MSIRILAVISLVAAAVYSSAPRAELINSERSNAFCVGVALEMMQYYNNHPSFFLLPLFANQVKTAMARHLKILELTGLSHEHPWRPPQDQMTMIQVEDTGISERKQCEEQSYPCFSKCLGPVPSAQQSDTCRRSCEAPRDVCASSFACIQ